MVCDLCHGRLCRYLRTLPYHQLENVPWGKSESPIFLGISDLEQRRRLANVKARDESRQWHQSAMAMSVCGRKLRHRGNASPAKLTCGQVLNGETSWLADDCPALLRRFVPPGTKCYCRKGFSRAFMVVARQNPRCSSKAILKRVFQHEMG